VNAIEFSMNKVDYCSINYKEVRAKPVANS